MTHETSRSIGDWADATFRQQEHMTIVDRALKEFAELIIELQAGNLGRARPEIADVVICLAHLMNRLGGDLQAEVDSKMEINRSRTWVIDEHGNGQHVK